MKHIKSINENQGEYLLITWIESSDEIHFIVIEMKYLQQIEECIDDWKGAGMTVQAAERMIEIIHNNSLGDTYSQSYVLEDWPFGKYNITKFINLPDLGC